MLRRRPILSTFAFAFLALPALWAEGTAAKIADPFMGDYAGTFTPAGGAATEAKAQVVALGKGNYMAVLFYKVSKSATSEKRTEIRGKAKGGEVSLAGTVGNLSWSGRIAGGKLVAEARGLGKFDLSHIVRKSPTEGLKPPKGAVVLLPFKKGTPPSLDQWRNKTWKALPDGSMQVGRGNNVSIPQFGDIRLHVEFLIPYEPEKRGQDRGNSGVYLHNRYEVQVLDSYGLVPRMGDCGAIYGVAPPRVNACFPPLQWQTYDIFFRAPRFSPDGKLVKPAVMTVYHNGVKIHEKQEVPGPTRAAGARGYAKQGPLMLQDHGHPVRYRNIWYVALEEDAPEKL